jgi:hypothetical protein
MKKLILIMALSISFTAKADDQSEKLKLCKTLSNLAGTIMTSRQGGVDMVDMYEVASNSMAQTMVTMAFDRPKFSSEKYRQGEVSRFKNLWFKECIKRK